MEDAFVCKKYLEQGYAPSVCGKGVADSGGAGVPHSLSIALPVDAAGGAGYVVFGGIGENGEFVHEGEVFCDVHGGSFPKRGFLVKFGKLAWMGMGVWNL